MAELVQEKANQVPEEPSTPQFVERIQTRENTSMERSIPVVSHINIPTQEQLIARMEGPRGPETMGEVVSDQLPRVVKRRIPSPVFVPSFNYTDKAFFSGLIIVTIASFVTRLYKLAEPNHVA